MASTTGTPGITKIFLVHGRNHKVTEGFTAFLRSLGLSVIDWSEAKSHAEAPNPVVLDIVKKALQGKAVLVPLSPDEVAFLGEHLPCQDKIDAAPRSQPRPNVLFEAGLAVGLNPDHTVIVSVGNVGIPSDLGGLHIERFDGSPQKRQALAQELRKAKCCVNTDGAGWLSAGQEFFRELLDQEASRNPAVERGVPAGTGIARSPYSFEHLVREETEEVILTGHNFGDQLKRGDDDAPLLRFLRRAFTTAGGLKITIIFAPPDLLELAHKPGYNHLVRTSLPQLARLKYGRDFTPEQQKHLTICCASGALSLACVARDIHNDERGLITVTPRWLTDEAGGSRMYFAATRRSNPEVFEFLRGQVYLIKSQLESRHPTVKTLKEVVLKLVDDDVRLDIPEDVMSRLQSSPE